MKCHLVSRFQEKSSWSHCFDPKMWENIMEVGNMKQLFTLWCPGSRGKIIGRARNKMCMSKTHFLPLSLHNLVVHLSMNSPLTKSVSSCSHRFSIEPTPTGSKLSTHNTWGHFYLQTITNVRLNIFNPHLIFKTMCSIIATFINVHLVSEWLNGFPQTTLEGNAGLSFSSIFWLLRLHSYPQHSPL